MTIVKQTHHLHSVIVSYNRLDLFKQCYESYKDTVTLPHSLVVVDNCSDKETMSWLVNNVSEQLVLLGENKYPGFATNKGWGMMPAETTLLHRSDNDFAYCVTPETMILGTDYSWHQAGDVTVGKELVGFDENVPGIRGEQKGKQRTLKPTVVQRAQSIQRAASRVITDCSPTTIASDDHLWLVLDSQLKPYLGRTPRWKATRDLSSGDRILRFGDPWGEAASATSAAYLAGLFDGEGCLSQGLLSFSQNPGVVLERGMSELSTLGFSTTSKGYGGKTTMSPYIKGGIPEVMRFLHQVPTSRFGSDHFWAGRQIVRKNGGPPHYAEVQAVEKVGITEVIAFGTSTATLITNGLYSHNCPGWCDQVTMLFDRSRVGQVGLRTDKEELKARWNVGGNNVIRRRLWDEGLRYDERPWNEYPPGWTEDSMLSPEIKKMGFDWTRVKQPCIVPLSREDPADEYYIKSWGDRGIEPPS